MQANDNNDQNDGKKNTEVEATVNSHSEMTEGTSVPDTNHEVAALRAVEMAQKEILYIRAEFENYKKRIVKEQENAIRFANKAVIADLLTVFDLFERAIEHGKTLKSKGDADVINYVNGVEMTHNELAQLMQRSGVEFVGAVGEAFNPELHEAISQEVSADHPADTVLRVLQKGCKLQGKLLKPARVIVSKKS